MKIEILCGGEFGSEQGAVAAAWNLDCPLKMFVRKNFITSNGKCEKLKFLGAEEIDSDRIRDCVKRCVDECNGVLLFRSGNLTQTENNVRLLVGDSRPYMEVDFLNPCDVRSVTVWMLSEGITKLYVTGKMDSQNLNIYFKRTFDFMLTLIKDINREFEFAELEKRKGLK